jgi:hypothetical protein
MVTLFRENHQRLELARAARNYAQHTLNPDRYLKKVTAGYDSIVAS